MSGEPPGPPLGPLLGPLLRSLRQSRDLTLEALAERSGISDRTISDIERGASLGPQRRTVELIASGLALGTEERGRLLAAARAGRHRRPESAGARAALPRLLPDFTGRDEELALLVGSLTAVAGGPAPLVLVHGLPGLGKTTLAVRAASGLAAAYDACLFVDLRGFDRTPMTAVQALTRLIGAVDPGAGRVPRLEADAVETWQDLVADRRVLVVLDNVASEAQVRALLPRVAPSAAVLTSRRSLAGLESVVRLPLAPLPEPESEQLLRRIVPTHQLGDEATRDDTVRRLAALCAGVPLALRIAGNRLASRSAWSARDLVDRLAAEDRRIDGLRAGDLDLRATITPCVDQLSPTARRAFRRLAFLPAAPFGAAACARLLRSTLAEAEDALDEISDLGLLQSAAQGRFQLHDLLRLYARDRLLAEEDDAERRLVATDLRHWLLATTIDAGRWFEPDHESAPVDPDPLVDLGTAAAAHAWLQTEAEHWLPAFQAAALAGEHRLVVDVAEALHWFSDRWMHWGHWHEVYAAGVAAARALGDDDLLATQLGYLSWAEWITRSDPATAVALAQEAREVAHRAGNAGLEGWALLYESWARLSLGGPEDAWPAAQDAATLLEAAGDGAGHLQALRQVAVLHQRLGRDEEALAQELRVLDVLDEHGSAIGRQVAGLTRIASLLGLAEVLGRLGRHEEAIARATESIALQHEHPVGLLHVRALRVRARAAHRLGRLADAEADLRAALELCVATGDAAGAAEVRAELRGLVAGARSGAG
jgi:transcriptional regulator with XRE-family HTH domain/tetratricopeptide (TPR) repeat protein